MSIHFGSDDYTEPTWSEKPTATYYFQVLKDGVIINTLNLRNKSFHLIGKIQDLCDVYIDNPSVSRKHAILQFKQGQLTPYLYDLGSTHGTKVNKVILPPRAYQKLSPYDNIKFGMSSRMYILRCPQLESQLNNQQEGQKEFISLINNQTQTLSKQKLKEKYLDLLENDPYHKVQNQSRKLIGHQVKVPQKMDGIDWGITDQNQIYGYKNQSEYVLEPDLLRRLPGLNQQQLNKIAQYQNNFSKYQEVQSQLNDLNRKEKAQFGLQEKLRGKKQKLQKKFIQAVEHVEKLQEWIRKNIFGQQSTRDKPQHQKQKQIDTYQDDQFMDRTLNDKKIQPTIIKQQLLSAADYWQLKKVLEDKLHRKIQLENILKNIQTQVKQYDQEDQLDLYMKANNQKLNQQTDNITQRQLSTLNEEIKVLQNQLSLEDKDIKQISKKVQGKDNLIDDSQENKEIQKKIKSQNTSKVLSELQKLRREKLEINQEDVRIFQYYKKDAKQQNGEQTKYKRKHQDHQEYSQDSFRRPTKYPKLEIKRDITIQQEQYVDLTKNKTLKQH